MRQKIANLLRRLAWYIDQPFIDFEDDAVPVLGNENEIPDMPEAEKDRIFGEVMKSTTKVLLVHMLMLKIPNFMHSTSIVDQPDGSKRYYKLTFERLPDEPTGRIPEPPVASGSEANQRTA